MGTRGLDLGTARTGDPGGSRAELRQAQRRADQQREAAADWLLGRRPAEDDPDAAGLLAAMFPDLDVAAVYWRKLRTSGS